MTNYAAACLSQSAWLILDVESEYTSNLSHFSSFSEPSQSANLRASACVAFMRRLLILSLTLWADVAPSYGACKRDTELKWLQVSGRKHPTAISTSSVQARRERRGKDVSFYRSHPTCQYPAVNRACGRHAYRKNWKSTWDAMLIRFYQRVRKAIEFAQWPAKLPCHALQWGL